MEDLQAPRYLVSTVSKFVGAWVATVSTDWPGGEGVVTTSTLVRIHGVCESEVKEDSKQMRKSGFFVRAFVRQSRDVIASSRSRSSASNISCDRYRDG